VTVAPTAEVPAAAAPAAEAPAAEAAASAAPAVAAPEAPAPPAAASGPPPAPPSPQPAAAPAAAGGIDTAAIRRAWPDVLSWLSRNKRVTWTLVSDHAHVHSYDGRRLEVGIAPAPLLMRFRQGPHAELIRQALIDVLGVDARVEGVPAEEGHPAEARGGQRGGGASAGPAPQAQAPVPAGADPAAPSGDPGLSAAARHTPESSDGWANAASAPGSAPSWASEPAPAAPEFSDAQAPPQISHLKRALAAVEAEGPAAAPETRVADDSAASDDDEDIEGLGEVGRPVIERILGGRVIEEG
jgi:DNA polymerase-3 subunit gamma/tau